MHMQRPNDCQLLVTYQPGGLQSRPCMDRLRTRIALILGSS